MDVVLKPVLARQMEIYAAFLDPKTAALVQVGVLVAIGSPVVCLGMGHHPGAGGGRN